MTHPPRCLSIFGAVVAALWLGGCSSLDQIASGDRVNYQSSSLRTNRLETPPDLITPAMESRFALPASAVSAPAATAAAANVSTANQAKTQGASGTMTARPAPQVLPASTEVVLERIGTQRFLRVKAPPEQVWPLVRAFWASQGFDIISESAQSGYLQTDWKENRANIPQDGLRRVLGAVFDTLYDTGERDSYRTLLTRTQDGQTEVTISHRGMQEVVSNSKDGQTLWQPRPSDPALELLMLQRLMPQLGGAANAQEVVAKAAAAPKLEQRDRQWRLVMARDFDYAWRDVGLALGRSGAQIADANRQSGVISIRVMPTEQNKGFFARLFGADGEAVPQQVVVKPDGGNSIVTVNDADGQPESAARAKALLEQISRELS